MKTNATPVEYEVRLRQDPDLAVREIGNQAMGTSELDKALHELCRTLEEHGIPYAVMGTIALGRHGFIRATTVIDLLMNGEGLAKFIDLCIGRGYVPAFKGARKTFRATETGVRVEVLLTGEYPGDGKPKPVSFPDPESCFVEIQDARVVPLETFIELKLASGMTAPHRLHDLADVQRLIQESKLPVELAEKLNAYVRATFLDLWHKSQIPDIHREYETK